MRFLITLTIGLGLIISAVSLGAPTCVDADKIPINRPSIDNKPVDVKLGLYVFDIESISDIDESFTLDMIITMRWQDSRLVINPEKNNQSSLCRFKISQIWHPHLYLYNIRNTKNVMDQIAQISANGEVRYSQRIVGSLLSPLNLRTFPFDSQTLPIRAISFLYGPDKINLMLNKNRVGRSKDFTINNWVIDKGGGETKIFRPQSIKGEHVVGELSMFEYKFHAKRFLNYYIWKVFVPIILIVMMSWAAFWIKGDQVNVRVGLSATTILTMIAYLFSLRALLPEVSYLTIIDLFIFACLAYVFSAFIETITVCSMHLKGHDERAEKIDRIARYIFPVIFVIIVCVFLSIAFA